MRRSKLVAAALLSISLAACGSVPARNDPEVSRPAGAQSAEINNPLLAQRSGAELASSYGERARNVILFVGDGMGVSTVTAARILDGQLRGETGEENLLFFEHFPYTAFSKVYNTNQQTPDSAGAMTAMVTGVKTKAGLIAVGPAALRSDCRSSRGSELRTFLEDAEAAGLATGLVTTARVTHATPASAYAHVPERNWEADSDIPADQAECRDIARQLIEFPFGDGIEVVFGGGRRNFIPNDKRDPEYPDETGVRMDGRDLMAEWVERYDGSRVVWNRQQFDSIDVSSTSHVLGLFERAHMRYELDREQDPGGEPSLQEMTRKAIEILSRNDRGYFLVVEGGRIDHAHHDTDAKRALTETIAFASAVEAATEMVELRETLIIVTADHSHGLTINGYGMRGNDILGLVVKNDNSGEPGEVAVDQQGQPYTVLTYSSGPGAIGNEPRPELSSDEVTAPDYLQEALIPLRSANHTGEDVGIYAVGPGAHHLSGTLEQNLIYYAMRWSLFGH